MKIHHAVHAWLIQHPWVATCVFILLTAGFVYANAFVEKGGVMDRALTNPEHPDAVMDAELREHFPSSQKLAFVYNDTIDTPEDLLEILVMNAKIERFDWATGRVLSLATAPDFDVTEDELSGYSFIDDELVSDDFYIDSWLEEHPDGTTADLTVNPTFDFDEWLADAHNTESVHGKLLAADNSHAVIIVLLQHDHNQEQVYWESVELLENTTVSGVGRWLRYDMAPDDARWSVGGWVVARETVDLTLRFDVLRFATVGMGLIFIIMLILFRSWRDALLGVLLIATSLIWTRGTIALLSWVGMDIQERVYILLVYANCIVQGSSLMLHKLYAFRDERAKGMSHTASWTGAATIHGVILFIAIISVGGMMTLYSFEVRTIREMGVLSGFGIGYLVLFAVYVLPSLHLLLSRSARPNLQQQQAHANALNRLLQQALLASTRLTTERPGTCIATAVLIIGLGVVLFVSGQVDVGTRPLEFIDGTHVHKTTTFLNQHPGSDSIEVMVRPKHPTIPVDDDLDDEFDNIDWGDEDDTTPDDKLSSYEIMGDLHFQQELNRFVQEVEEVPLVRSVGSVSHLLRDTAQELFGTPFPKSSPQLGECRFLIQDSSLPATVRDDLYTTREVKISIFLPIEDSAEILGFVRHLQQVVAQEYPNLELTFGGKSYLWAAQDELVYYGKPINVATSEVWVFLIALLMILYRNRKRRGTFGSPLGPIRTGLVLAVPLLFASGCVIIVMATFGIRLDQANAVIMALALGASIDFSLYYVDAFHEAVAKGSTPTDAINYAVTTRGQAIGADVLVNAVGFLPLYVSSFGPVRMIGLLTALMVLFSGLGALAVMPAMLGWTTKK